MILTYYINGKYLPFNLNKTPTYFNLKFNHSIYKMFVNLLFIYVNILTQSLPLHSERLHFKVIEPHLVQKTTYILLIL